MTIKHTRDNLYSSETIPYHMYIQLN